MHSVHLLESYPPVLAAGTRRVQGHPGVHHAMDLPRRITNGRMATPSNWTSTEDAPSGSPFHGTVRRNENALCAELKFLFWWGVMPKAPGVSEAPVPNARVRQASNLHTIDPYSSLVGAAGHIEVIPAPLRISWNLRRQCTKRIA